MLRLLANDLSANVRRSVAGQQVDNIELLIKLSHDTNEHVLMTLATNASTPLEVLEKLKNDPDREIQRLVWAKLR